MILLLLCFLMVSGSSLHGMNWERFEKTCAEAVLIVEQERKRREILQSVYEEFMRVRDEGDWGNGGRFVDGAWYNYDDVGLARLQRELQGIIER